MLVTEPVISLRAVVAIFGRFPALAGANLEVNPGEIVLVQGANGAGKSTLLQVCAGLKRLSSGQAKVLGCDLTAPDRAAVRRRVGFLGHHTALYDDLTAAENLQVWARASRVDPATVTSALARLDISPDRANVTVSRLSAGQRRRVALAAVLVRRPELWLLDEPHASLDQPSRDLTDGIIAEVASAGATVLMASHNMQHATDLATRTVTMAGGMVIAGDVC